jgi:hypothetical protein
MFIDTQTLFNFAFFFMGLVSAWAVVEALKDTY